MLNEPYPSTLDFCPCSKISSQVDEARKKVEAVREELESLISLYRKQLKMHSLNFMNVSGTTHLIEVICMFNPFILFLAWY